MPRNILVTSSRGVGLHTLVKGEVLEWGGLTTEVIPGGRFSTIAQYVRDLLPSLGKTQSPPHIYIMTGIPDITTLYKGFRFSKKYKECILLDSVESIVDRVKFNIDRCSVKIRNAGGIPIFCTITHMNITKYNQHSLEKNKTFTQLHSDHYKAMQTDTIIDMLNKDIVTKNRTLKMEPFNKRIMFHVVSKTLAMICPA